jgi:hypothetical protein
MGEGVRTGSRIGTVGEEAGRSGSRAVGEEVPESGIGEGEEEGGLGSESMEGEVGEWLLGEEEAVGWWLVVGEVVRSWSLVVVVGAVQSWW